MKILKAQMPFPRQEDERCSLWDAVRHERVAARLKGIIEKLHAIEVPPYSRDKTIKNWAFKTDRSVGLKGCCMESKEIP